MRCSACGHENPGGSRFCLQCGAALGVRCGGCEAELPAGARYCNQCGAAVAAAGASTPAAAPGAEPSPPAVERYPRDYTPRHLAEKILTQKSALEGERKQVTVLFADVKSSLGMQSDLDPEDWHGIMDRFFQLLADGVHRFEGTINQYTGDGIMALFGAPIAHEDHAQRACYAALHLSDALRDYARELRRERGLDFSTRMGINSGEVVVGKIGDDLRMDYTAQGQTVGLAARMEGLAEPGKAYLTGHTAGRVQGYFELEDLGSFNVHGVAEPVPVFELVGVGTLRTRFDLSRARGLSRFVGREVDMQLLESAFESARGGRGRAVGVVADAGVGKSRLCFEFTERCRAAGLTVLAGSGVAHGRNLPLLPILEIFRGYFGIVEHDDARSSREKVAGRLLLIDESFREVLPLVFDFLGVPDPERPSPPMDAEARQRRLVAVVRRLIERGNPNGFVILIEDLHWVDAASDAFIAEYVDAIANGPGLLLLNFRPEYRASWMGKTWYQQMPLHPLGPEAIRELLDDLLGDDSSIDGLADRIHERTHGNPYFTEEIVRSLVDSGALVGMRGHYHLTSPVEALEVPYSVHAVLSARIDRLAEREKQLLQKAAVIGKEFAEPVLAAVAELPSSELADALSTLCNGEFVHQQTLYPIAEYAFAHPLTREVALGSQLQEQRRKTHAAVARAIEESEPERLDERAALLAHHYEEAGRPLEAARFHARAATWTGTKDLGGTLRHWQSVRELVRTLPAEPETLGLRELSCLQILMTGGFRLGLSEAAVDELYREGRDLAERSGNADVLAALRGAYAARLGGLGRVREQYELNMENTEATADSPILAVRAGGCLGAGYSSFLVGRMAEALRFYERGLEIVGDDLEIGRSRFGFSYQVFFASNKATLLAGMGQLEEALGLYAAALRLARDSSLPENLGWTRGNLTILAEYTGETAFEELGDVTSAAVEAMRIAEDLGSAFSRLVAGASMGSACLLTGRNDDAAGALRDGLELARRHRVGLEFEALLLARLAQAHTRGGDTAAGQSAAEEAVAAASERGQRFWEIQARLALAEALTAGGATRSRGTAEKVLVRAEALVAETGARVLAPQVAEARARLLSGCGERAAAEESLREALRLYTEVGATGHARRLERELGAG